MAGVGGASRVVAVIVGAVLAVSVAGMITFGALEAFVLDKYNAYGEVAIPGSAMIELPAGEVTVSLHARTSGRGLTVPPLTMSIIPPPGGSDPAVTDELGSSTTINDDVHRQVWVMQVADAGRYQISADGPVGGLDEPRLAFGHTQSAAGWLWVFVALSIVSADLAIAVWWMRRRRNTPQRLTKAEAYIPTDQGVRLEQLKTIAALRDSGALMSEEFEAEKKRILDGR